MVIVSLLPNDCDKELHVLLHESARKQNISEQALQREILCNAFNIPKNHNAMTKELLLHQVLTEKSFQENGRIKQNIRKYLREYFGLPIAQNRKCVQSPKTRAPLRQREKRFKVLNFLVTVEAATTSELDQILEMNTRDTLRTNLHYFQRIRIPYHRHYWWRVTERGRQDYSAIVGQQIGTVEESKLESTRLELKNLREGDIQERIVQEEQEKKIREQKIQVRKIREQKRLEREQKRLEKAEKIRQLEQKKAERRKIREQKEIVRIQAREYMELRKKLRENERLEKEERIRKEKEEQKKLREERKKLREEKRREEKLRVREQERELRRKEQIRQLEQEKAERKKIREQERQERQEKEKIREQNRKEKEKIREQERQERQQKGLHIQQKAVKKEQRKLTRLQTVEAKKAKKEAKTIQKRIVPVKKVVEAKKAKKAKTIQKRIVPVKKVVPMTEAHRKYLALQEQKAAKEAEKEARRLKEAKIVESFKADAALRANEHGIRKFFLYDLNNPIDAEIVKKIGQHNRVEYQEQLCRKLLSKRLLCTLYTKAHASGVDQVIENRLLQRCKKNGKTRNEYVRQLLCIQLNIREGYEVVQTSNPIPELMQTDFHTSV